MDDDGMLLMYYKAQSQGLIPPNPGVSRNVIDTLKKYGVLKDAAAPNTVTAVVDNKRKVIEDAPHLKTTPDRAIKRQRVTKSNQSIPKRQTVKTTALESLKSLKRKYIK